MIVIKPLNERISEGDKERAANSYIMSIVAIMAGMPLPIINLLATLFFLIAHRKGSYFGTATNLWCHSSSYSL